MKALLMSLTMVLSLTSVAHASVVTGHEAQMYINTLKMLSESQDDIEMYNSKLGRGVGDDNVMEEILQISGKLDGTMMECESHTFHKYEVSEENMSEYVDSASCEIRD